MQKKIARGLKELKESMGLDSSFLDELVRAAVEQHEPLLGWADSQGQDRRALGSN